MKRKKEWKMKINLVPALIAFAIAALAGYGFFAWNGNETYQLLVAVGAGLFIFITMGGTIALTQGGRGSVGNIRALSVVFLILAIISNILFSIFTLPTPTAYVIINGILLLLYVLIAYAVNRAIASTK